VTAGLVQSTHCRRQLSQLPVEDLSIEGPLASPRDPQKRAPFAHEMALTYHRNRCMEESFHEVKIIQTEIWAKGLE
jgi:hypothetical protein